MNTLFQICKNITPGSIASETEPDCSLQLTQGRYAVSVKQASIISLIREMLPTLHGGLVKCTEEHCTDSQLNTNGKKQGLQLASSVTNLGSFTEDHGC